jgi:catechol 2,3-dioxygenase-like lactoylglutathione lyase family enzyme
MALLDFQRVFHHGVRVPDIDAAMAELGRTLGLRWATVQHNADRAVWTPDRGLEHVELTFVYSCDGPHRIELLQGQAGSVWDAPDDPGLHHAGVWSDDVAADTEALVAAGWTVTAAAAAPDDGYGSFSYVRPPSGLVVELVTTAAADRFERWWAGEPLGSERA